MLYYKIILNNEIVGVCNSDDCYRFQEVNRMLIQTIPEKMEYLQCVDVLYHALWMQPIKTNLYSYQIADIIEIDETEYNILVPAVENNPIPIEDNEEEIPSLPEDEDELESLTFEFVLNAKINEMSHACHAAIEAGFDLDNKHYSFTTEDQLNIMELASMIQSGMPQIPYHADGEASHFISAGEAEQIVLAANTHKMYHQSYFHCLRDYINSLDDIHDIVAITYGITIPEEFENEVYKMVK